jgi:hypothetical protein
MTDTARLRELAGKLLEDANRIDGYMAGAGTTFDAGRVETDLRAAAPAILSLLDKLDASKARILTVDSLANEIRRLGGTSVRGCVALAQGLMPFLAAPPSSPSERDAALEEAAKHFDEKARASSGNIFAVSTSMTSICKEVAKELRALKASRSDTVEPEAGE